MGRCSETAMPTAVESPAVGSAGPSGRAEAVAEIGLQSGVGGTPEAPHWRHAPRREGVQLSATVVRSSMSQIAALTVRPEGVVRIQAGQAVSTTVVVASGPTAEAARLLSLSTETPVEISAPGCQQAGLSLLRCPVPALAPMTAFEILVTMRVPAGAVARPRRLLGTWGTRTLEWPLEILPDRWSLTPFGTPVGLQAVLGQPSTSTWRVRNSQSADVSGLLLSIMAPPPWPFTADRLDVELQPEGGAVTRFSCPRTFTSATWLMHDCIVPAAFPARTTTFVRLLHPPAQRTGWGWHTLTLTAPEGTRFATGSPFVLATIPYVVTAQAGTTPAPWPVTRQQCAATRLGRCWRLSPAPPDTLQDAGRVIQAMMDTLAREGGGELQLVAGRWPLQRRGTAFLQLRSRVHLSGVGPQTLLEPLPQSGPYAALVATDTGLGRTRIEDVTVRDLTLRQDPDRNPSGLVVPGVATASLVGIRVLQGARLGVHRVSFDPFSGVHAMTFNGPIEDVVLSENLIRFRPAPTTVLDSLRFDNAAVYVQGSDIQILGNRFEAQTSARARAAIETHARPERLAFNTVDGWRTGITLASSSAPRPASNTHDIVATRNTIRGAVQGIRLWPATGDTLRQILLSENDITLQPWLQQLGGPTAFSIVGASAASANSDGRIEQLEILRNRVRVETVGPTSLPFPSPAMTGLVAFLGTGSTQGVRVEENTFTGGIGPVVRLGTPAMRGLLSDVVVTRNTFLDLLPRGAVGLHNTALVRVEGRVARIDVTSNTFQAGPTPATPWPCVPVGLGPVNGVPTRLWWAPSMVEGVVRIQSNLLVPAMTATCWRQRLVFATPFLQTDW